MKTYIVKSFHEIYKDDYENGQMEFVNGYTLNSEVQATDPKEAITKYLQDELGFEATFEDCEIDLDEPDKVQTSLTVDEDNTEPSDNQYKEWKEGKTQLYDNEISLYVYEVKPITF